MFDINFIAEPGVQKNSTDAYWSFLHNNKNSTKKSSVPKSSIQKQIFFSWKGAIPAFIFLFTLVIVSIRQDQTVKLGEDMVLNQVIDLIVESGYMNDVKMSSANFGTDRVIVTIGANDLQQLQDFSRGYRKEDNIPYQIYKRDNQSYVNLIFPWNGSKKGGDIQILKSLAVKTVFSNKISIHYTEDEFELQGRSSDIISYLLQMAESDMIQKFSLSVRHLESGKYFLKVNTNQI